MWLKRNFQEDDESSRTSFLGMNENENEDQNDSDHSAPARLPYHHMTSEL